MLTGEETPYLTNMNLIKVIKISHISFKIAMNHDKKTDKYSLIINGFWVLESGQKKRGVLYKNTPL
jgi:hypothetical protein